MTHYDDAKESFRCEHGKVRGTKTCPICEPSPEEVWICTKGAGFCSHPECKPIERRGRSDIWTRNDPDLVPADRLTNADKSQNHQKLASEAVDVFLGSQMTTAADRVRMSFYLAALRAVCAALLDIADAIRSKQRGGE